MAVTLAQQTSDFIALGNDVIDIEQQAIARLKANLDDNFNFACNAILACKGRVIVTGMGKSGHIGRKIAATFASTGTPSFFVHPAEASHGDLGMITPNDVVLAISNSGETGELVTIIPIIKRQGVPLISMTANAESTLARACDIFLNISVQREACSLNLAPTASTTVTLVLGDALAIALLNARGFSEHDFALSHPGGALGRKLLLRVEDIMHTGGKIPFVHEDALLKNALLEMTRCKLGFTAILNQDNEHVGIFTDGDLRRAFEKKIDFNNIHIKDIMTKGGTVVTKDILAQEALRIMEASKINSLLVADSDNKIIGALNMHDILKAGII